MAVQYHKKCGTRDFMEEIIGDFMALYPNAVPPSRNTIWRQVRHLDRFSTLHNLNSKVIFCEIPLFFICLPLI